VVFIGFMTIFVFFLKWLKIVSFWQYYYLDETLDVILCLTGRLSIGSSRFNAAGWAQIREESRIKRP